MLTYNLAVKFNLLKDTKPHYIYKPESCLEIFHFQHLLYNIHTRLFQIIVVEVGVKTECKIYGCRST
jgi:hypothetical protein